MDGASYEDNDNYERCLNWVHLNDRQQIHAAQNLWQLWLDKGINVRGHIQSAHGWQTMDKPFVTQS